MSLAWRLLDPALVEALNQLQLSARSVVEGSITGPHRSPVKGASVDFRQHRFYVPGDEPRRLDWRVLARTDRHYIREYDEETNLRALLMIDTSASMGYRSAGVSKLEYAARFAAALAYLTLGQTENLGLALAGSRIDSWLAPHNGPGQLARVIELLERAGAVGTSGLAGAMHESAERLGRRGLVIVLSDLLIPVDQIKTGLAHLRHERHETILLRILDRDELEFPFKTWTQFKGAEGERPRLVEPAVARKNYLESLKAHRQQLQEMCTKHQAELHEFASDEPLLGAITQFLRHRAGRR